MNGICACGKRLNDKNDICCDRCFAEYIEQHYLEYILENANDFTVEKLTITEFCKQDRSHFIEFLQRKRLFGIAF